MYADCKLFEQLVEFVSNYKLWNQFNWQISKFFITPFNGVLLQLKFGIFQNSGFIAIYLIWSR